MKKLTPSIASAAAIIKSAVLARNPIMIRYNNDADGVTAGAAIYLAILKILAAQGIKEEDSHGILREKQNNSAIYSIHDAEHDLRLLEGAAGSPLVICLDFSANEESAPSLKKLKENNCRVLIIDHHPFSPLIPSLCDLLVSPWCVKGGVSDYTAGLLACEVAKKLDYARVERLQLISLIGDKSKLLIPENQPLELRKAAEVIDFVCVQGGFKKSLSFYAPLLSDQKQIAHFYLQSKQMLDDAVDKARKRTRIRELENGFVVAIVNIDGITGKSEYPQRGKLVTSLHDSFEKSYGGVPLVTIGTGQRAVTFRANKNAKDAGFNANALIISLRSEFQNGINSGGGHDMAASARVEKSFSQIFVDESVKRIGGL